MPWLSDQRPSAGKPASALRAAGSEAPAPPTILAGRRDAANPDAGQLSRVLSQQARGPLHPLQGRCQLEREFPQDQCEGLPRGRRPGLGPGGAGAPEARSSCPCLPPPLSRRRMRSPPAKTGKPRMPPQTTAKVRSQATRTSAPTSIPPTPLPLRGSRSLLSADGLAYSALLKNELLGAGIEKVQDPQTEDRRLQPSTPEKKGLFTVSLRPLPTRGPRRATWLGPGSVPARPSCTQPGRHVAPCHEPRLCSLAAVKAELGQGPSARSRTSGWPRQELEEPGLGLPRDGQGAGGRGDSGEANTGKSLSRQCLRPEAWFTFRNPSPQSSSGFCAHPACLPGLQQRGGRRGFGRELPELGLRLCSLGPPPNPASSIPSAPSAPALTMAMTCLPTPCPQSATRGESGPVHRDGAGTGPGWQPRAAWEAGLVQDLCSGCRRGSGGLPRWGHSAGSAALGPAGKSGKVPEEVLGGGPGVAVRAQGDGRGVVRSLGITWAAESGAR